LWANLTPCSLQCTFDGNTLDECAYECADCGAFCERVLPTTQPTHTIVFYFNRFAALAMQTPVARRELRG
jgi:hypothetical protein